MKLTDYKKAKRGRTWADIGGIFGLQPYQIYRLAHQGYEIKGRKPKRRLVKETVHSTEIEQ